jgi:NAD-dependent DNA ligase
MKYYELFESDLADMPFQNKQSEITHLKSKKEAYKIKLEQILEKLNALMADGNIAITDRALAMLPPGTKAQYRLLAGTSMFNQRFYGKIDPQYESMFKRIELDLRKIEIGIKEANERIRMLTVKGMTFCFTGFRDEDDELRIQKLGGIIKSSVVKDLDFLIAKDPTSRSGKAEKAREQGTKVLSKSQLEDILRD